jgi:hypothetical protein
VERRVAELVGPDAPHLGRADVRAEQTGEGRYRIVVSVNTTRGPAVRQFEAASCPLATDIAALLVAISLYPERSAELEERARANPSAPGTSPGTSGEPVPPATRAPPSIDAVVSDKQSGSTTRSHPFSLAAAVLADLTSMPSAAFGGGGTFGFRPFDHLSFEASAGAFASQTVDLPDGRSARFGMQNAAIRGCFVPWTSGVFAACIGAVGIRLAGRGSGVERPHDSSAFYVGPSAGFLARVPAGGRLRLRASVEAFVPLAAHRFLLDGVEVHQPNLVGIAGQVGPEVSF